MVDRRSRPSTPRFVIVTPVYDEVDCLPLYVEAVTRIILDRQDVAASVLFIDDGSTDKSWNAIEELCDRDKRFQGIRLSRNVGSHTATMAAFHNLPEDVDAAVIMGCDLQDPPETALALLDEWRSGADIVWGQRRTRDDPVVRRVGSKVFHALLRRSMPHGSLITAGGFILMDRRVVSAVVEMKEQNRVTFALVAWTGFEPGTRPLRSSETGSREVRMVPGKDHEADVRRIHRLLNPAAEDHAYGRCSCGSRCRSAIGLPDCPCSERASGPRLDIHPIGPLGVLCDPIRSYGNRR